MFPIVNKSLFQNSALENCRRMARQGDVILQPAVSISLARKKLARTGIFPSMRSSHKPLQGGAMVGDGGKG